ncbi:MAG: YlbF family regulator [Eubacteriales bacterium]|nr:YlbF family regulator [Eubacteriales bacterium]
MAALERQNHISDELEEILEKTDSLMDLLRKTDSYRRYQKHLAALREQPEVMEELNAFRRENIEIQFLNGEEEYYEQTEKLQEKYKNILMESVVMDFLSSEQRVCKMMRKLYGRIAEGMSLDISYMEVSEE